MGSVNLGFLLFHILLSISLTLTTAQPPQVCSDTGNFTSNSIYGRNRDQILSSLASNTAENGGFYNATIGQEPNKIYALALCTGQASSESCFSCVNSTVHDLVTLCPNQKEAIAWGGGPCTVRYTNRSIFGRAEVHPTRAGYNTGKITMDLSEFDQIWGTLMDRLVTEASMGSPSLKLATGEKDMTLFQRIYAMLQCTPDLSQTSCDFCLRTVVSNYNSCCHGYQGGFVQVPSCWFRWDLYPFYELTADAPSPSPPPPPPPLSPTSIPPLPSTNTTKAKDNGGIKSQTVVLIIVPSIIFLALVILACILLKRRKPKQDVKNADQINGEYSSQSDLVANGEHSLQFEFAVVRVATDNFSDDHKLGQGGFGAVYKGRLPNGQDIAVKRLSRDSGQGELEFKNEVMLMSKLQHRNLVRLLGFCLEGNERLLIYEFVLNSSLERFIFDPIKHSLLDWKTRYKIIEGIARGLLYLHEDSRFRIIHRDLKASNILLDANMNPKISDFGMARLFAMDQIQDNTSRIVGTFGYMAPEYVMHGHYSIKSDVFSFGVLVLEIITGKKNTSFRNAEGEDLLTHAWRSWNEDTTLTIIDPILTVGSRSEIRRCIHIGLLCVQENVTRRPTMASIVLMLSSISLSLNVPSKPAFFMHSCKELEAIYPESTLSDQGRRGSLQLSINEISITELDPR